MIYDRDLDGADARPTRPVRQPVGPIRAVLGVALTIIFILIAGFLIIGYYAAAGAAFP